MARQLDEYKPLSFYADNTKAKQSGFSKFEVEGEHFFCRYVDGDIALISQSYRGKAGRDNGIESVRKNEKIKERYRFDAREGGGHGFSLLAGNRQEIAVSPGYATEAEAQRVAGRLNGSVRKASTKAASAKKAPARKTPSKKTTAKTPSAKATSKRKTTTAATAAAATGAAFTSGDTRRGNYKPLDFYIENGGTAQNGFDTFERDGAHYFSYRKNGQVHLISEAYTAAKGRDNGVASVEKNIGNAARYKHRTHSNGQHYFDLVAGNNQEIATSVWYDSDAAAKDAAASLRGAGKDKAKTAKPKAAKPKAKATKSKTSQSKTATAAGAAGLAAAGAAAAARTSNVEENYQPLSFYRKNTTGTPARGIETFDDGKGAYFFVYNDDGKPALISESYPSKAARDRGAASVEKNIGDESRYDYSQGGADGKTGFRLKAGNNREIARSVAYGSAAAATAGAAYLLGTRKRPAPKPATPKTASSKPASPAPAAAKPAAPKPDTPATPPPTSAPQPRRGGAGPLAAAVGGAAGAAASRSGESGAGAASTGATPEYTDDYLPCDAYKGHPVSDPVNRVALFQHSNGRHFFVFYDPDGDVRWRSEGFATEAARQEELDIALRLFENGEYIKRMERGDRYIDMLHDETGREIARSCLCTVAPVAAAAAPIAAAAAPVAAAAAPAAAATAATAAAATTAAAPAAAVASGGGLGWLKWLLLIPLVLLAIWGLSQCFGGDGDDRVAAPAAQAPAAAAAAMVECPDGSEAETLDDCPVVVEPNPGRDTAIAPAAGAAAAGAGAVAAADSAAGSAQSGMDGTMRSEPDPEPEREARPEPTVTCRDGSLAFSRSECPARPSPARSTARTELMPVTPATAVAGRLGFFNTDACQGRFARVAELGTNPEYGDSHTLGPDGFYNKLARQHAQGGIDRTHLDALWRALGYRGFSDADASQFSNATLASGTTGILGFGAQHGLQCANLLPTANRDLEAFAVQGANGRTVYFMKTCGIYFFPGG